jgi:excinuclease UvrABC ATPase subunit
MWLGGNLKIDKVCSGCHGKRYNQEALSVLYNGRNIYEVLEMSISDARSFFRQNSDIHAALQVIEQIGMGYIKLGQPTSTLSGGEAQRIKLAKELWKKRKGNILYVLDEPTTGLSPYDTSCLISLLDRLAQEGNSVIVIEHDTAVLATCDWIIELGPGGGSEGGTVVATGTPAMLKNNPNSVIGRYL